MSDAAIGAGQNDPGTADAIVKVTVTADATVITYPQKLLAFAKGLIDAGEFSIAVVVAHVACEVAADRSFTKAFAAKGIDYLEEPIGAFFSGSAISRGRNQRLYTALTGDGIQEEPFWPRYLTSVTRRNRIAHKGEIVGKTEAEESFAVATDFVAHLEK